MLHVVRAWPSSHELLCRLGTGPCHLMVIGWAWEVGAYAGQGTMSPDALSLGMSYVTRLA